MNSVTFVLNSAYYSEDCMDFSSYNVLANHPFWDTGFFIMNYWKSYHLEFYPNPIFNIVLGYFFSLIIT